MNKSFVKLLQSCAGIALLSTASLSMAATWDYDFDDGDLEAGYQPLVDGDLIVNGYYNGGRDLGYAYIDADSQGRAGLGVCDGPLNGNLGATANKCGTTGDANGQNTNADDSLQTGELLEFVFSVAKEISVVGINDHNRDVNGDKVLIWSNGNVGGWDLLTVAAGKITLGLQHVGLTTLKIFGKGSFGQNGDGTSASNLYVAGINEVPLPAAAWLFGSALLGLAGLRRRKIAA